MVEQERKNPHYDLMYKLTAKRAILDNRGSLEPSEAEAKNIKAVKLMRKYVMRLLRGTCEPAFN